MAGDEARLVGRMCVRFSAWIAGLSPAMTIEKFVRRPVMAGLVPAIHDVRFPNSKDVDARHKAGHDDPRAVS
jgi:hypothetical protein